MISKVDFVGIPSQDAERSRTFYVETLGLRPDSHSRFEVWAGDDPATLRRVEVVYCLGAEDLALGEYGLSAGEAEALCTGDGTAEVVERWTPAELEVRRGGDRD